MLLFLNSTADLLLSSFPSTSPGVWQKEEAEGRGELKKIWRDGQLR